MRHVLIALLLAACSSSSTTPPIESLGTTHDDAGVSTGGSAGGSSTDAAHVDAAPDAPSTGGANTGGSAGECSAASDCPGADTACLARTCINSVCGVNHKTQGALVEVVSECESLVCDGNGSAVSTFAPLGTPTQTQVPGDCHQVQCDGHGGMSSVVDDTDINYVFDSNSCTTDACAAGVPVVVKDHGTYCADTCATPPCGTSDATLDDDVTDWGVCDHGVCATSLAVKCKTQTGIWVACAGGAVNNVWIDWGPACSQRCMGTDDRGYCAPGTPCTVHDYVGGSSDGVCL